MRELAGENASGISRCAGDGKHQIYCRPAGRAMFYVEHALFEFVRLYENRETDADRMKQSLPTNTFGVYFKTVLNNACSY